MRTENNPILRVRTASRFPWLFEHRVLLIDAERVLRKSSSGGRWRLADAVRGVIRGIEFLAACSGSEDDG